MEELENKYAVIARVEKRHEQRLKILLVFTLVGLPKDLYLVYDEIWLVLFLPTIDELFS